MKKIFISFLMIFVATLCLTGAPNKAVVKGGGLDVEFTQPNGVKLNLRVIGNKYYARTETLDGYTVIYQPSDNTYYYALLNHDESALVATKLKVGIDDPAGLKKRVKLSTKKKQQKELRARVKRQELNPDRAARWAAKMRGAKQRRMAKLEKMLKKQKNKKGEDNQNDELLNFVGPKGNEGGGGTTPIGDDHDHDHDHDPHAAPVNGSKVGLTILAQFPDDPATPEVDPVNFPATVAKMERFCNEIGYNDNSNTGSVRDYFLDQSEGLLDYTMKVSPIITLPQPRNYYNFSDYPTNEELRDSGSAGNMIVRDSIAALNDINFDFDGLTVEDGEVRSTNVFFAGSNSGVWSEGLWPHQWGLYRVAAEDVSVDGTLRDINQYQITNLSTDSARIGTFIHESGHLLLDFPDLYDTDVSNGNSDGLGLHALMSSGNHANAGRTPTPINLYLKDVVGWANITDILPLEYHNVNLPSTGNVGYRYTNPNDPDEYFIIENRGFTAGGNATDKWAQHAPDRGIMIWHVDEGLSHNQFQHMTSALHYHVSLEQQDGLFELENDNGSDSQDLYDNNSSAFNDASLPNANWWSGAASGIQIKVNSAPGPSMNVVFGQNNTITVLSPNGGEPIDIDGDWTIKWVANIVGNVKIDLFAGGNFLQTISANEVNDGSYEWNLGGAFTHRDDYTIRISSVNDSSLYDFSDADFSIAPEVFVSNGVIPAGWVQSAGSQASWVVTSDQASEGQYSLINGDVSHFEEAAIEYSAETVAGTITFDARVSSEARYDFLRFYIDGVEQDLDLADADETGLSGIVNWTNFSFNVTEGNHTFKWVYEKDGSISSHEDKAWIDNVVTPGAPLTGIAKWKNDQFGGDDPVVVGDTADPDKDGIPNVIEYALGLDPNKADSSTGIEVEKVGNTLSLIYPKNQNATDVNYFVERISNIGTDTWAPYNGSETTMSSSGNVDVMKATMTVNSADKTCFMRLRVEMKP